MSLSTVRSVFVVASCTAWVAACSSGDSTPAARNGGAGAGNGGASTSGAGATTGTGGTGISVTTGSGGTGTTGGGCARATVKTDPRPASILVVVDRSGSMNCNLPPITDSAACEKNPVQADTTQPTKWSVVRQALKDAFAALPPSASAGLSYFNADDECAVYSMPSVAVHALDPAQVGTLGKNLDTVRPKGGTPIVGATVLAYKHLHQQAQASGNKFVLLLTDGAETCDADKVGTLSTEIPKALSVNIRTFVIGAPGSESARAMLSEMAYLGGSAQSSRCQHGGATPDVGDCHFDMTTSRDFGADLAATLARISGATLSCEFDVPAADPGGGAVDLARVNVHYTRGSGSAVDILQDTTKPCDAGAEGWQYSADKTQIVLCGAVCDEVKADRAAKIDVVLGCGTVVK